MILMKGMGLRCRMNRMEIEREWVNLSEVGQLLYNNGRKTSRVDARQNRNLLSVLSIIDYLCFRSESCDIKNVCKEKLKMPYSHILHAVHILARLGLVSLTASPAKRTLLRIGMTEDGKALIKLRSAEKKFWNELLKRKKIGEDIKWN